MSVFIKLYCIIQSCKTTQQLINCFPIVKTSRLSHSDQHKLLEYIKDQRIKISRQ